MNLKESIELINHTRAYQILEEVQNSYCFGGELASGSRHVFSILLQFPELANGRIKGESRDVCIDKWVQKYKSGYDNRPSQRVSNPMGTVEDQLLINLIRARVNHLQQEDLAKISSGHRISMAAENIQGLILEEYLSNELAEFGWHCAWGESLKAVDFINENGGLLQVKSRYNSENSSSRKIRDGTDIKIWKRIRNPKGDTNWEELNSYCDTDKFSEESYSDYALRLIEDNPGAIHIADEDPWITESSV
jgi:hypothetical protein